ncbi:MAG: transposase [Candidatus Sericytochromatia bacterium]
MLKKERKLQRLQGYDYSQDNFYFVTICTHKREHFFGEIKNGEMILNILGEIVKFGLLDLPNHYFNCFLDKFVIMPNHIHCIIFIDNNIKDIQGEDFRRNGYEPFRTIAPVGNGSQPFPISESFNIKKIVENKNNEIKIHGLSEMIRSFKTFSSKRINVLLKNINITKNISKTFLYKPQSFELSQLLSFFKDEQYSELKKYFEKLEQNFELSNQIQKFQWHKSFHDRIIRSEKELNNVRNYIKNNPLKWAIDIENSKKEINDKKNNDYYDKILKE